MFSALLILLTLPFADLGRSRGIQFRPLSKIAFYVFIVNFFILMVLGAKHVESPYIELGQITTVIYFGYFLIVVPFISLLENSLVELNSINNSTYNSYRSSTLNSYLYIGKRNFSTTTRRLTDTPSDQSDGLDEGDTAEEDAIMEERLESIMAKDQLERQKEELESIENENTSAKIEYVKDVISGDRKYENTTVTEETVDGIIEELKADFKDNIDAATDDINYATTKLAELNNNYKK